MIEVTFLSDQTGRLRGFTASGHSGYAKKGSDIVCAAVSAVTQGAVVGLEEVLGLVPTVDVDDNAGFLKVALDGEARAKEREAQAILETAARTLEQLAEQYPRHLRVRRVTVRNDVRMMAARNDGKRGSGNDAHD